MKKVTFYSRMSYGIKEHNGYTDGSFLYYRAENGGLWHAIHPDNGLSVARGHTLKETAAAANTPELARKIAERLKIDGPQIASVFRELVAEYVSARATA